MKNSRVTTKYPEIKDKNVIKGSNTKSEKQELF